MRLLICTQAIDVNDPTLGFFHRWVEEFATHCESIHIICLTEGKHTLPAHVSVHSLGKEDGASRTKYIRRFYRYAWSLRNEYDAVFVHMNPEYVLLGGVLWRILGKRVVLWYVHRQVGWMLRAAVFLAHAVCTSARQSINVRSRKIAVVGHGIDTAVFGKMPSKTTDRKAPRIVSVGRITPIKNLETIIEAVAHLRGKGIEATLDLIGEPTVPSDASYVDTLEELLTRSKAGGFVKFLGSIPHREMPQIYARYDVSVNACPTGGIDKAVLEYMASGIPVVVSNESFREFFGPYANVCIFAHRNVSDLAGKIERLLAREDLRDMQKYLQKEVRERADVSRVVSAIMERLYARASSA